MLLGQIERLEQAFDDARPDGMHLGLDRQDQHAVDAAAIEGPQPHRVVFVHGGAGDLRTGRAFGGHRCAKNLALIDRQRRATDKCRGLRRPGALGLKRPAALGHWPLKHPGRQRHGSQGLAGIDVLTDPLRDLRPAGRLPGLEGSFLGTETPAHRQIDVAGTLGNRLKVDRGVVP